MECYKSVLGECGLGMGISFSALTQLVGSQEGHRACKNLTQYVQEVVLTVGDNGSIAFSMPVSWNDFLGQLNKLI